MSVNYKNYPVMRDYIYDEETYPNVFLIGFVDVITKQIYIFEVSDRRNQLDEMMHFCLWAKDNDVRLVGFNNLHFDEPILQEAMTAYMRGIKWSFREFYNCAMSIIKADRFSNHQIWADQRLIEQVDLLKIHHFDNANKSTSLKVLEINMRMESVQDLPYAPGTILTHEEIDWLIYYLHHDLKATFEFYDHSLEAIKFREELTREHGRDFINHNDTKIGKDYFIMELEKANVSCYMTNVLGKKIVRSTPREFVDLGDVILPSIHFERPEFQRTLDWLKGQRVYKLKGGLSDTVVNIDGFDFVFGLGGIHGSVESQTVRSTDDECIIDIDVKSFYPNLAIVNGFFPEHLSKVFCDVYKVLYDKRAVTDKKSLVNAILKLALNGVYGDSNNQYSPFYDPKYTLSITLNGQLLLAILAEQLIKIPGLKMIQANTDGITVKLPRVSHDFLMQVCKWWEGQTNLILEYVEYSAMFIKNVNAYIAVGVDGNIKRKKEYCHVWEPWKKKERDLEWHQDMSSLVVAKAAEAALVRGEDITTLIMMHDDPFDFMIRAKVPKADLLIHGENEIQKTSRYYVSIFGETLMKISPPIQGAKDGQWKRKNGLTDDAYKAVLRELKTQDNTGQVLDTIGLPWDERINTKNQSTYKIRRTEMCKGWKTTICNDSKDFNRHYLDYSYYIEETRKIVEPLQKVLM